MLPRQQSRLFLVQLLFLFMALMLSSFSYAANDAESSPSTNTTSENQSFEDVGSDSDFAEDSIITRSLKGGPIVFSVLMILISLSLVSWAIALAKWYYLRKMEQKSEVFIKSFWDSRSLNDLNNRLSDYPYSPVREVFRNGYTELVRGSQLREQALSSELAISAAMDNLQRSLNKAKMVEKRKMETFLPVLAISASAAPFIGLFGTVWGIMNAFEKIFQTQNTSLAAVAPGISEALIATAFGLAAAIPAVIGYNIASNLIRHLLGTIDGFGADYMNIVERYLVVDRSKVGTQNANTHTPGI